jgi:hypothetical protein
VVGLWCESQRRNDPIKWRHTYRRTVLCDRQSFIKADRALGRFAMAGRFEDTTDRSFIANQARRSAGFLGFLWLFRAWTAFVQLLPHFVFIVRVSKRTDYLAPSQLTAAFPSVIILFSISKP